MKEKLYNKLKCPVCSQALAKVEKTYQCENGHSYDLGKNGSLNLLMSQKRKEKQHGDDVRMVQARSRFLGKEYYQPIRKALAIQLKEFSGTFLDLGCGEGWYTKYILDCTKSETMYGLDISKVAISEATKQTKDVQWLVGSSYDIPLVDQSVDVAWSVFAPFGIEEVKRIIKGYFVHVFPQEDHLIELKEELYEDVYKNKVSPIYDALFLKQEETIYEKITVRGDDLPDLLTMTPYGYRTPKEAVDRLSKLEQLTVTIAVGMRVYERIRE